MNKNEISKLLKSSTPVLVLETHEERRAINLLKNISISNGLPVSTWSIASGMQRMDLNLDSGTDLKEPGEVLAHIKTAGFDGIYILLDFHPYLKDPLHVRLLKELAMAFDKGQSKIVLISHEIETPEEIRKFAIRFELSGPGRDELA